jgi:hypothetical protein
MKMDMIILRETPSAGRPTRGRDTVLVGVPRGGNDVRSQFVVEVKETTEEERRSLRNEAGVVAAPPMPVMLIKSFRNGAAVGGQPPKLSWGIPAVYPAVAADPNKEPLTGKGRTRSLLPERE